MERSKYPYFHRLNEIYTFSDLELDSLASLARYFSPL